MTEATFIDVDIDQIHDSPFNPRSVYTEASIAEMAESIEARIKSGLDPFVQDPVVRPVNGHYELVVGHRRKRGAAKAGLDKIRVKVVEIDDTLVRETQLIENNQREDVHPLEEVDTIVQLMKLGHSAPDVAARLGKNPIYVHQRLRLVNLCASGKALLLSDRMALDAGLALSRIEQDEQEALLTELGVGNLEEFDRYLDGDDVSWRMKRRMPVLDGVSFPTDEKVGKTGPCTACPKRTGAQSALFADALEMEEDRCTDTACFGQKQEAFWPTLQKRMKSRKIRVLKGKKPAIDKKPLFSGTVLNYEAPFVDTQSTSYIGGKPVTNESIAMHIEAKHWLCARDDSGTPRILVDKAEFNKALKKLEKKSSGAKGKGSKPELPADPTELSTVLKNVEAEKQLRENRKAYRAFFRELHPKLQELSKTNADLTEFNAVRALGYGLGAALERRGYYAVMGEDKDLVFEALNDAVETGDPKQLISFVLLLVNTLIYPDGETNPLYGYALAFAEEIGVPAEQMLKSIMDPIEEKRTKRAKRDAKKVEKAKKISEEDADDEE